MALKGKHSSKIRAKKKPYLTKRILLSAAKSAGKKAELNAMLVMGHIVTVQDGWVIKKFRDGTIERIKALEPLNTKLALD